ncbi:MAG: acyltransferase [Candidatus Thorarchaeota archaeon]
MTNDNAEIGQGVEIHPTAKLLAKEIVLGDFTKIGENVKITGGYVNIGRDAWISTDVLIGGGRAEMGSLKTGDFLHLGKGSMVNIADEVTIGDEVGIGMDGRIFTHGAYLSEYDGFPHQEGPVSIGSNVWLPYAIVNPNITIGDNVVVAAMSLVNKNLPSGCLAGGIPVKILRENEYPKPTSEKERIQVVDQVLKESLHYGIDANRDAKGTIVTLGKTVFNLPKRTIEGPASENTERMKDLLRRHGIRFRFYSDGEEFRPWD